MSNSDNQLDGSYMIRIAGLVAGCLLLYLPTALAWGDVAHEAVCEIAFLELNDQARARVTALIQQDPDFTTFRASCNWADAPIRQRASEHFVNLSRDARGIAGNPCPTTPECVIKAIEKDAAVLASQSATDPQKLVALKLLGHWVGDVHQPLHVSFADDKGGNAVRVQGGVCGANDLHGVWDSCIVEQGIGTNGRNVGVELRGDITAAQRTTWLASNATAWANEAFAITIRPEVGYCVMVGDTCQYSEVNRQLDPGEPQKLVVVNHAYLDGHEDVVREQIAKAGVRLAGLINQTLGDGQGGQ